ncbi:Crp/Fnr family transcriptional regulator [Runella aurantiaca]|jgi:CRP-like cAMP-binding protein|uniref:Crp/Fnr family transcriptional regulator n=1 Tax=Runella aurantiaca TaxID=2282308 RepID=A0A369I2S3_9BACT|nr:Crp/Fnr family transcriptional regulator [Runella aurantiaca]RDB02555.1 Crp/Fnr family transcriptional regulator [Runella aurantiaca]
MTIQPLIDHFESYLPFDENEKELLQGRVTHRSVKRRYFILQEGFTCKHYTFVVEGCFRMFAVDTKGNEHNIKFTIENDWISDIGSFHSDKPSKLYIEAIEPAVILQIEQQDLYFLYTHIPKLNQILRVIVEDKYVELQNRVLQNISSTALERYLAFQEQYPTLSRRLPNTQIASYLGITPEFLSKLRKDIASS